MQGLWCGQDGIRPVRVYIPFFGAKRDGCNPGWPIANPPQDPTT
jgi:hypothetical protein